MAMTRRGFLGAIATAVVGTCVATKVPTAWLPPPVRRRAACEYMRREFNAWVAAHRPLWPGGLVVGGDLYEAYESEILANERFSPTEALAYGVPMLMFKATSVTHEGRGWGLRILDRAEWDAYRHARWARG